LFSPINGADRWVHGLTIHHHNVAFFNGIELADGRIAFQEFNFFFCVIQRPAIAIETRNLDWPLYFQTPFIT
jgi:hypothetical protein